MRLHGRLAEQHTEVLHLVSVELAAVVDHPQAWDDWFVQQVVDNTSGAVFALKHVKMQAESDGESYAEVQQEAKVGSVTAPYKWTCDTVSPQRFMENRL